MSGPQLQSAFLHQIENQLEVQLQEVISVFQNLPQEILLRPGAGNGWSIAECFAHLNSYADFYVPRLDRTIERANAIQDDSTFKHSLLGRYFIRSMNPDLTRRKFKAMRKHSPGEVADPYAVVASFIGHLEKLLVLSRNAQHKVLKRNAIATSIAPILKINAGDAIVFLITHNRRHLNQAKRVLEIIDS